MGTRSKDILPGFTSEELSGLMLACGALIVNGTIVITLVLEAYLAKGEGRESLVEKVAKALQGHSGTNSQIALIAETKTAVPTVVKTATPVIEATATKKIVTPTPQPTLTPTTPPITPSRTPTPYRTPLPEASASVPTKPPTAVKPSGNSVNTGSYSEVVRLLSFSRLLNKDRIYKVYGTVKSIENGKIAIGGTRKNRQSGNTENGEIILSGVDSSSIYFQFAWTRMAVGALVPNDASIACPIDFKDPDINAGFGTAFDATACKGILSSSK